MQAIKRLDAVVLAGRSNTGTLKAISDEKQEALIPLAGRPQVEYVLDALLASELINHIFVVAPQDLDGILRPRVSRVDVAGDMLSNLRKGLARATTDWVLVSASDVPLLQGSMVDDFLRECFGHAGAAVYMPVVGAPVLEALHPDMKRTFGKVREGRFTGGNLFLIKRNIPPHVWQRAEEFVAARKSVMKLASLLGIGFILRMLLLSPSIEQLEKRIGQLAGLPVKAVQSTCAELAVDCDKPSDFVIVESILQKRRGEEK